jgi:hypothetical protein
VSNHSKARKSQAHTNQYGETVQYDPSDSLFFDDPEEAETLMTEKTFGLKLADEKQKRLGPAGYLKAKIAARRNKKADTTPEHASKAARFGKAMLRESLSLDEHDSTFEQRMSGLDNNSDGAAEVRNSNQKLRNPFDEFDPSAPIAGSDPFDIFEAPAPPPLKPAAVRRSESIEETKIEGVLRYQKGRRMLGKWSTLYFVAARASSMRWNGVGFTSRSYLLRSFKSDGEKFSNNHESAVHINLKNVLVAKIGERTKNGEHEFSVMYTDPSKATGRGASSTATITFRAVDIRAAITWIEQISILSKQAKRSAGGYGS